MPDVVTILVVDDDPRNAELLKAILEPHGYRVATAYNGVDALELLARQTVGLVLLDVMMPKLDGYEVTRRIRADPKTKGLPVILVTALHETSEKITGIEAGCDEFVTKPFDKNEVIARIKTLLRLSFYRAQLDEKEKFEQVINRMNDGLLICDAELRIVRSNRTGREFLGSYDLSAGWLERLEKTFTHGYKGDLTRDLALGGLDFDLERPETATAKPLILSFSSSLIKDSDGKLLSVVVVLHDVTDKRKEQFVKEKFLGLVSYKLKTPLAESLEQLAVLKKASLSVENKPFQRSVELSVEKVTEFLRMIEKIFELLELSAATRFSEKRPSQDKVDMGQFESLARAALKGLAPQAAACSFDLPGGLAVAMDPGLLEIVLKNLVENAVKFNDRPPLKLAFSARQEGDAVKFTLTDNGPGIPGEDRRHVLEAFFQGSKGGARPVLGQGLGLAIVKTIIESGHGTVAVGDAPERGAAVSFTLPLLKPGAQKPSEGRREALAASMGMPL